MWTWVWSHLMSSEFLRGPHISSPGLEEGVEPLEQMWPLGGTNVSFHIKVQSPGRDCVASAQGARVLCALKTCVLLSKHLCPDTRVPPAATPELSLLRPRQLSGPHITARAPPAVDFVPRGKTTKSSVIVIKREFYLSQTENDSLDDSLSDNSEERLQGARVSAVLHLSEQRALIGQGYLPSSFQKKTSKYLASQFTSWKKSYEKPRQHIKKQGHLFITKSPYSQNYGFSSHVQM